MVSLFGQLPHYCCLGNHDSTGRFVEPLVKYSFGRWLKSAIRIRIDLQVEQTVVLVLGLAR